MLRKATVHGRFRNVPTIPPLPEGGDGSVKIQIFTRIEFVENRFLFGVVATESRWGTCGVKCIFLFMLYVKTKLLMNGIKMDTANMGRPSRQNNRCCFYLRFKCNCSERSHTGLIENDDVPQVLTISLLLRDRFRIFMHLNWWQYFERHIWLCVGKFLRSTCWPEPDRTPGQGLKGQLSIPFSDCAKSKALCFDWICMFKESLNIIPN